MIEKMALKQIRAILEMKSPTTLKEIQSLNEQPPSTVSSSGLLIDASLSSKPSRGRNVMSGMKNAKKPSKT